jgi:hypothetical protein
MAIPAAGIFRLIRSPGKTGLIGSSTGWKPMLHWSPECRAVFQIGLTVAPRIQCEDAMAYSRTGFQPVFFVEVSG